MKPKYILGLGAGVMDYLQVVDEFPMANTKVKSMDADLEGGGSAMTALVTMAHFGLSAIAISVVGKDELGKMIVKDLKDHHLDTRFVQRIAGKRSSLSSVIIARNTRTIIGHYELEDDLNLTRVKDAFWKSVRLLHLDGHHIQGALQAVKKVRAVGGVISIDGGHASPDIKALLPYADIMIMSETFVTEQCTEKDIAAQMESMSRQYHPQVLIITRGEKGVWYWENGKVKKLPAFQVKAKDTTGAGDVFHGAFLFGYLKKWSLEKSIQFAQAASALKVQYVGARHGIPSKKVVEHFLKKHQVS